MTYFIKNFSVLPTIITGENNLNTFNYWRNTKT